MFLILLPLSTKIFLKKQLSSLCHLMDKKRQRPSPYFLLWTSANFLCRILLKMNKLSKLGVPAYSLHLFYFNSTCTEERGGNLERKGARVRLQIPVLCLSFPSSCPSGGHYVHYMSIESKTSKYCLTCRYDLSTLM